MRSVIYKITYKPHLNTEYPKYYIGSKYNYKGNYWGSVASTAVFNYTNNIPLKKWWSLLDKDNLKFEVLEEYFNITPQELISYERKFLLELNVLSSDYFNQHINGELFYSGKKSTATKQKISDKTKAYWQTDEGREKSARLSARNKITKSTELKLRLQTNLDHKEKLRRAAMKPKTETTKQKMSNACHMNKAICIDGVVYKSITEATKKLNLSVHYVKKQGTFV